MEMSTRASQLALHRYPQQGSILNPWQRSRQYGASAEERKAFLGQMPLRSTNQLRVLAAFPFGRKDLPFQERTIIGNRNNTPFHGGSP